MLEHTIQRVKEGIDRLIVLGNQEPVLTIRRVIWFFTGGLWLAILYCVAALVMLGTIVFAPFSLQVLRIALFALDGGITMEPFTPQLSASVRVRSCVLLGDVGMGSWRHRQALLGVQCLLKELCGTSYPKDAGRTSGVWVNRGFCLALWKLASSCFVMPRLPPGPGEMPSPGLPPGSLHGMQAPLATPPLSFPTPPSADQPLEQPCPPLHHSRQRGLGCADRLAASAVPPHCCTGSGADCCRDQHRTHQCGAGNLRHVSHFLLVPTSPCFPLPLVPLAAC